MTNETDDKPDFASILDTPVSEISRPKPPPAGTFLCMNIGLPQELQSPTKGTKYFEYTLRMIEPATNKNGEYLDVDPDALEQSLTKGDGEVMSLSDKTLRHRMWRTPDADYRHVDFLKDLGIEANHRGGKSKTLGEMIAESPGRICLAHIRHRPNPSGDGMFAEIDKTTKAD